MDVQKLQQLLAREEGPKLDFKLDLSLHRESAKRELAKDVSAIANSRGGRGYIVIGIKDKSKEVSGIDQKHFSEEKIQQIISNRCDPPIPIRLDIINYKNKDIAIITIYKSNHRPHQMLQTGGFYIRRGSTTGLAHREEIASMLQETGLINHETMLVYRATLADLDGEAIYKFFRRYGLTESISLSHWESAGFIGRNKETETYHPTIGGLLLFGKKPQLFLPYAVIKIVTCLEKCTTKENNAEVKYFEGTIIQQLDAAQRYINKAFENFDYPVRALDEALTNAIVHRDYLHSSKEITVSLNFNKIIISNPGSLLDSVEVYLNNDNIPNLRNPWLYHKLLLLDKKKRFARSGLGLTYIKQILETYGVVDYQNYPDRNLFQVILPGIRT